MDYELSETFFLSYCNLMFHHQINYSEGLGLLSHQTGEARVLQFLVNTFYQFNNSPVFD